MEQNMQLIFHIQLTETRFIFTGVRGRRCLTHWRRAKNSNRWELWEAAVTAAGERRRLRERASACILSVTVGKSMHAPTTFTTFVVVSDTLEYSLSGITYICVSEACGCLICSPNYEPLTAPSLLRRAERSITQWMNTNSQCSFIMSSGFNDNLVSRDFRK